MGHIWYVYPTNLKTHSEYRHYRDHSVTVIRTNLILRFMSTHKRKRSLQDSTDSTIGLSRMRMALNRLDALKAELDEIEQTEEEMLAISEHVLELENILRGHGVKKPVCCIFLVFCASVIMMLQRTAFSTVTLEDLKKAGIKRKCLCFEPQKVAALVRELTMNAEIEIADLYSRIKKIYAHVNMDVRLRLITFAFGCLNARSMNQVPA